MMSCPQCYSQRIHPSRRIGFMERKILPKVFVKPFRCERCDLRFFRCSFNNTTENATRPATSY